MNQRIKEDLVVIAAIMISIVSLGVVLCAGIQKNQSRKPQAPEIQRIETLDGHNLWRIEDNGKIHYIVTKP